MAGQAKYLFDQDFGAGAAAAEKAPNAAELAAKLAEAESSGYRNGFTAASTEESALAQRQIAAAFETIGQALGTIASGLHDVEARLEAEAIELAAAIARKLAPALMAREPAAEIAALATDCFKQLASAPHIVVRVHPSLHDLAQEKLDGIARSHGFEGRLMILGEPELVVGDCRIEWADGGVVRDTAAVERTIGFAVGRYVSARFGADMPPVGNL